MIMVKILFYILSKNNLATSRERAYSTIIDGVRQTSSTWASCKRG